MEYECVSPFLFLISLLFTDFRLTFALMINLTPVSLTEIGVFGQTNPSEAGGV